MTNSTSVSNHETGVQRPAQDSIEKYVEVLETTELFLRFGIVAGDDQTENAIAEIVRSQERRTFASQLRLLADQVEQGGGATSPVTYGISVESTASLRVAEKPESPSDPAADKVKQTSGDLMKNRGKAAGKAGGSKQSKRRSG